MLVADSKGDLQKYLHFLHTQLKLIHSKGSESYDHLDLISPIFQQLRTCTNSVFCDEVKQWHQAFLENIVQLCPITIINKADTYMDILKQVGDWNDTSNDTQIAVLQACLTTLLTCAKP